MEVPVLRRMFIVVIKVADIPMPVDMKWAGTETRPLGRPLPSPTAGKNLLKTGIRIPPFHLQKEVKSIPSSNMNIQLNLVVITMAHWTLTKHLMFLLSPPPPPPTTLPWPHL